MSLCPSLFRQTASADVNLFAGSVATRDVLAKVRLTQINIRKWFDNNVKWNHDILHRGPRRYWQTVGRHGVGGRIAKALAAVRPVVPNTQWTDEYDDTHFDSTNIVQLLSELDRVRMTVTHPKALACLETLIELARATTGTVGNELSFIGD